MVGWHSTDCMVDDFHCRKFIVVVVVVIVVVIVVLVVVVVAVVARAQNLIRFVH